MTYIRPAAARVLPIQPAIDDQLRRRANAALDAILTSHATTRDARDVERIGRRFLALAKQCGEWTPEAWKLVRQTEAIAKRVQRRGMKGGA